MAIQLYLDVCCLNRPFDDHSQDRIRLEAEAVLSILSRVGHGEWSRVSSEVMDLEVERTPDPDRGERVRLLMGLAGPTILVGVAEAERARQLEALGFRPFDALHLSCAESGAADVFLTTDDRLLRLSQRVYQELQVRVDNPVRWFQEIIMQ